tara:strand:+ start:2241 stop:2972 length:732 start_codon:yes stop_codon:yes gene_type:complete
MNKGIVVIPARYESSRFPGKPLANLCGKPLLQHVYDKCCLAVGSKNTLIATDSLEIQKVSESFGAQTIMTSRSNLTGTDRIAEVASMTSYDFYINVQGDEPLLLPEDIKKVYDEMCLDSSSVINCFCRLEKNERNNPNIPKVIFSKTNKLIYMSRGDIPFDKTSKGKSLFKQVCIYGFNKAHLEIFSSSKRKSYIEENEDIEILRFLELDVQVRMIELKHTSISVDTPRDLEQASRLIESIEK